MRCLQPITVNGKLMPCGRCPSCLRNRQNEWVFRLNEELRISPYAYFFTLTYRDDSLPILVCDLKLKIEIPTLFKRDIQLFMKRLRKNTNLCFKYHVVGEYGPDTLRPHYHGLLFSQKPLSQDVVMNSWAKQDLNFNIFEPCFSRSAVGYVTKYICAVPFLPEHLKNLPRVYRPFSMCSKGLGLSYLETNPSLVNKKVAQIEDFVVLDGKKMAMPRYYRDKLFPLVHNGLGLVDREQSQLHYRHSLKKQELSLSIEEKRYKNFLFKNGLEDSDSSRMQYEDYKKMLRSESWRKAYKNSKYNLSKMKI